MMISGNPKLLSAVSVLPLVGRGAFSQCSRFTEHHIDHPA